MTDWREELFKEKNPLAVFKLSYRVIGDRKYLYGFFIFLSLVLWSNLCLTDFGNPERVDILFKTINIADQSNFTLGLIGGLLGFLITGFSIFATMTDVKAFRAMAQTPYDEKKYGVDISQLKFVFLNFIHVFYVLVLIAIFVILLRYINNSFFFDAIESKVKIIISVIIDCISLYIFLLVSSFIWNLYQAVLYVGVLSDHFNSGDKPTQ